MRKTGCLRGQCMPGENHQILADLETTDLSQREISVRRGMPPSTLHTWLRRRVARRP